MDMRHIRLLPLALLTLAACGVEYVDHQRTPIDGNDDGTDTSEHVANAVPTCSTAIAPADLAFGTTALGTTSTITVTVDNADTSAAELLFEVDHNVRLCSVGSDPSVFCLAPTLGAFDTDGILEIPSSSSVDLEVRFAPVIAGIREQGQATLTLGDTQGTCSVRLRANGDAP